jgi:HPt (histidine-containing phosphotransfer) domain-containing protein
MSSFDATMATLRARFVARAAEDLLRLRGHQSGMPLPRQDLHWLAHRLAGSAGLFGFDEVGLLAGELDDRLASGGDATTLRELLTALEGVVSENRSAD